MSDAEFLRWMADRLVYVYGESANTDFVQRLHDMADEGIDREVAQLRHELEEAHLARIEAQNPGIDMDRVRRERNAIL